MEFRNIHGEVVKVPSDLDKKVKAPPKPKAAGSDVYHKGWLVTGHSPKQVAEYKAGLKGEEFNLLVFARHTKFKKLRTKPYESSDAANKCAEMAIKEGWLNVEVKPVTKGAK